MTTRTLVIGLDGATFDLINPWIEQKKLPVLAKLMQTGVHTTLKSVYPVLSSSAWTSFMTGVNPAKHGLVDFVERKDDSYTLRLVHSTDVKSPTLWQMLSQQGKKTCVINVPMTYPPLPVNGLMITGLGTPLYKTFTYPQNLTENLTQRGYKVDKEIFYSPDREDQYLKAVYDVCDRQLPVVKELLSQDAWDFFMYVFRDTDELAHFFWRHMDGTHPAHTQQDSDAHGNTLLNFYQNVDRHVGELIKAAGDNVNVLIVSDHGFGPLYKDVFLNEFLAQQGFLVKKEIAQKRQILARLGLTRLKISSFLRGIGLHWLENRIKDALGEKITLLPRDKRPEFADGIDWLHTTAYSFGYHGQIYINLKDREPEGIVNQADYESAREQIIATLKQLRDPQDGQLVVDQIFKREELFNGPYLNKTPDLVVVMRDFSYITRNGYELGAEHANIFSSPLTHESGSHRLDGILIAQGPTIREGGQTVSDANIIDLTPTILHLLNCAIPQFVEGQVLKDLLKPTWFQKNAINYQSEPATFITDKSEVSWSDEDEAEVIERLKNLGYLS